MQVPEVVNEFFNKLLPCTASLINDTCINLLQDGEHTPRKRTHSRTVKKHASKVNAHGSVQARVETSLGMIYMTAVELNVFFL